MKGKDIIFGESKKSWRVWHMILRRVWEMTLRIVKEMILGVMICEIVLDKVLE